MPTEPGCVLVTGGLGYIGRSVVSELVSSSHQVLTLDNAKKAYDDFPSERVIVGDYGDRALLSELFSQNHIQAVIHLAAKTQVGESVREPWMYYENNLGRFLVLLKAILDAGVKKLLFASSAAVYGDPQGEQLLSEERLLTPTNPYGFTKLVGERILRDCSHSYGLSFLAFRFFNVAGQDGDRGIRKVIPTVNLINPLLARVAFEKRQLRPDECTLAGVISEGYPTQDGTCVRDYVHVADIARAHSLGLDYLFREPQPLSESINLGTGKSSSIKDVVQAAKKVTGFAYKIPWQPRPKGFPATLVADNQKAKKLLGWEPRFVSLEQTFQSEWDYLQIQRT